MIVPAVVMRDLAAIDLREPEVPVGSDRDAGRLRVGRRRSIFGDRAAGRDPADGAVRHVRLREPERAVGPCTMLNGYTLAVGSGNSVTVPERQRVRREKAELGHHSRGRHARDFVRVALGEPEVSVGAVVM